MANAGPTVPGPEEQLRTAGSPEGSDNPNVLIRPPIALALAAAAGLAATWLYPLPFVPAPVPAGWVGAAVCAAGFALGAWAVATMRRAGTRFETHQPTTRIVRAGPYRFTRNPIYVGMFLILIGLAIGFDSLWLLVALAAFYLVIRYGVVAREEAYLERKFADAYLDYKARVRRWV
jgi:protein-S-isoprenylcysteine O-methyltransferase Ste14